MKLILYYDVKMVNGGAIEVKLGAKQIEESANNLKKFKEKVDVEKSGEPSFLLVLSGGNYHMYVKIKYMLYQ